MINNSRAHLAEAGEAYLTHMQFAVVVGLLAIGAGLACLLHAAIPGLCQRTCSRTVGQLQSVLEDRQRLRRVVVDAEPVLAFAALLFLCLATALPLVLVRGGSAISFALATLAFAIPATFVATNPQLG